MTPTIRALALALLGAALAAAPLGAEPTPAAPEPPRPAAPAAPTAESEFNRGLRAQTARDWSAAVAAYRRATELRPAYAEAWNGLGFALRSQGRPQDALAAYYEALRLRPEFPEALEYLGAAYVKLGRLDDARRVLERLRSLDAGRARELAAEIARAR